MPDVPRSHLVAYALCAVLVAFLGWRTLRGEPSGGAGAAPGRTAAPAAEPAAPQVTAAPAGGTAVVHVAGAVRHPGVYRLRAGARVQDAVRRAGGPRGRADVDAVNLAARVTDGQQVVVPSRLPSGGTAVAAADPAAPAADAPPVSLGSATAEQLDTLDGVGPATAQKIIAWRTEHGGFRSVDDLGQIPGIGPKRLATLRPHVQP